jgi:hypothetical protein
MTGERRRREREREIMPSLKATSLRWRTHSARTNKPSWMLRVWGVYLVLFSCQSYYINKHKFVHNCVTWVVSNCVNLFQIESNLHQVVSNCFHFGPLLSNLSINVYLWPSVSPSVRFCPFVTTSVNFCLLASICVHMCRLVSTIVHLSSLASTCVQLCGLVSTFVHLSPLMST